jgi:hypothetical protein
MASLYDRQKSLTNRTTQLRVVLGSLLEGSAEGVEVQQDLLTITAAWEYFCQTTIHEAERQRTVNASKTKDKHLHYTEERARQKNRRRRLQVKERTLDVREQELEKALEGFVVLYSDNLKEMELVLQEARQSVMRKEAAHKQQMFRVEKEMEEALQRDTMPRLLLEGLGNPSICSSVLASIDSGAGDIVSNRSAFSYQTEPGGDLSQRGVPRPPVQAPPKVKFQYRIKEAEKPRIEEPIHAELKGSVNHSFNSDSLAFDSMLDHLKNQDFSCDYSKIESESELGGTTTSVELRRVLDKAVEFNFDDPVRTNQDVLAQVKEARKLKDVPSAYNVISTQARMKSIVKLLKQKRNNNKPISLAVKQHPSTNWRKRLQIQGPGEEHPDMASTTPKSVFFREDHDLSHTVQSSNPFSSRLQGKEPMEVTSEDCLSRSFNCLTKSLRESDASCEEQESIESLVSDIAADHSPHDVNISDLLNAKDFEDQIGDLSSQSGLDPELSVIRGLQSMQLSGSFDVHDANELEVSEVQAELDEFDHNKVRKKSSLSEFSGVLNSGSTQSDLNSRF